MKVTGSCHCGAIAYEAEVEPGTTGMCHCADCQTLSGSAFRTVVFTQEGSFSLRSGEPKIYIKTSESGRKRAQAFCPVCGTPIYATSTGDEPKAYNVRLGAVRQRNELLPRRQIFVCSQQSWVHGLNSIPKFDRMPP